MFDNQNWKGSKSSREQEEFSKNKRHLVVFLLAALLVILALTVRPGINSAIAESTANQTTFLPVTSSGYFEGSHLEGISGRVYAYGKPAAETKLELRHNDGSTWTVVKSVKTSDAGYYFFDDIDSLGPNEQYYVSFGRNETNPDFVYFWYGPIIDSFKKGDVVFGGSFDIADMPLKSPASGTTATLPVNFRWEKRGLPGDTYRLVVIDLAEDVFWRTFDLGDVDSFTLNGLAPDMVFGKQYAWYIEVYMGPDSFGESYMINDIKFLRPSPQSQSKAISEDIFIRSSGRGGR